MQNKVDLCGVNTARLKVLKSEETRALLLRARAGDKQAREELIAGNLRLVLSVIHRFSNRGENVDDLFQVGCIGLMKAIDHFDDTLGLRFSTYGQPMIAGEIRRFLRDNNAVRVSRGLRDIAYRAMQARERLQKSLGKEPPASQIAKEIEVPEATVVMAMESVVEPVSLYEPVYSEGGDTLYVMDQVSDSTGEESWISSIQFRDTMKNLSPREKKIMSLRYLAGKTQMEVAKTIGISQAQVSRLEKNALCRLKQQM